LVEDDAGAEARPAELRTAARAVLAEELLEEVLEEGIVASLPRTRRTARMGLLDDAHVDHRGSQVLGHPDEGRLQALRGRGTGERGPRRRRSRLPFSPPAPLQ